MGFAGPRVGVGTITPVEPSATNERTELMDAVSLATVTAAALAPYLSYLLKGAQFFGEKVVGAAAEGVGKFGFRKATELWEHMKARSADTPKLAKAAELVAMDSTDQDALKLLAKAILDLFSKDSTVR